VRVNGDDRFVAGLQAHSDIAIGTRIARNP
jgi:hypothetical protein